MANLKQIIANSQNNIILILLGLYYDLMKILLAACTIAISLAQFTTMLNASEEQIDALTDEQILTNIKRSLKTESEASESITINYGLGNSNTKLASSIPPSPTNVGIEESLKRYKDDFPKLVEDAYEAALLGHYEASLMLYKKAFSLQPDNLNIAFSIGSIYQKQQDYDRAKQYYKIVLSRNINHKQALNNYLNLIADENPGNAQETLHDLLELDPDFHPLQAQVGLFYAKQKDYAKAIAHLKRALELDKDNIDYLYNLGVIYDRNGQINLARAAYLQVLKYSYKGRNLPVSKKAILQRIYSLHKD